MKPSTSCSTGRRLTTQLFRDAFNEVQDTGSNRDFGVTKDSRIYFDLSGPSPSGAFGDTKADPPSFNNPNA